MYGYLMDEQMNQDARDLKEKLRTVYQHLWDRWYADQTGLHRAGFELKTSVDTEDSDYSESRDLIVLHITRADLAAILDNQDPLHTISRNDLLEWPVWACDFIEEMVHEYQHKVVDGEHNSIGESLFREFGRQFSGRGHGPDFFTAVAAVAAHINRSPYQLAHQLAYGGLLPP